MRSTPFPSWTLRLAALPLLLASPLAGATCTNPGSSFTPKNCANDTIDELQVDNSAGLVLVSMGLDDEANLTSGTGSCTLANSGGLFPTTTGIALRSTHPQYDKAYHTLLTATASFQRVKIIIATGPTGTCDITDVSLTP